MAYVPEEQNSGGEKRLSEQNHLKVQLFMYRLILFWLNTYTLN